MRKGIDGIIKALESYPAPHLGRPGQKGGSAPRGGTNVGITSARPGVNPADKTQANLDELTAALSKTPVKNLKTAWGVGGYEGTREPTFVVSYDGNGKARAVIAAYGKKWVQDSVLEFKFGKEGPDTAPFMKTVFANPPRGKAILAVERKLRDSGFGGWTWEEGAGGLRTLILAHVPQWSKWSTSEHRRAVNLLNRAISEYGGKVSTWWASTLILDTGNYDKYM